jgi:hypothetical protein
MNPRSHNHPMFGSPVIWLFEYVLGIRQKSGSTSYEKVIINPLNIKDITDASGSIETAQGKFAVEYKKKGNKTEFVIEIPKTTECEFVYEGNSVALKAGVNKFEI